MVQTLALNRWKIEWFFVRGVHEALQLTSQGAKEVYIVHVKLKPIIQMGY